MKRLKQARAAAAKNQTLQDVQVLKICIQFLKNNNIFVCCLLNVYCLMFVTSIINCKSINYEIYYYKMYNNYYKMYNLLLQNVQSTITKCTWYYYKMYNNYYKMYKRPIVV